MEIEDDSPADDVLLSVMTGALTDRRLYDVSVDLGSVRIAYRHPRPCLLREHRADPGPRVCGLWHTDWQEAAATAQRQRDPSARALLELASEAGARRWASELTAFVAEHAATSVSGRVEVLALRVPAVEAEVPARRGLVPGYGAELWLWFTRPRSAPALRRPVHVPRIEGGGSDVYPGPASAAPAPVGARPRSSRRPHGPAALGVRAITIRDCCQLESRVGPSRSRWWTGHTPTQLAGAPDRAVAVFDLFGAPMPLIHVTQAPGRTAEQKAELLRELTDTYVKVTGAKPEAVWVTVAEVPADSWSVAGDSLAARAAKAKAATV